MIIALLLLLAVKAAFEATVWVLFMTYKLIIWIACGLFDWAVRTWTSYERQRNAQDEGPQDRFYSDRR